MKDRWETTKLRWGSKDIMANMYPGSKFLKYNILTRHTTCKSRTSSGPSPTWVDCHQVDHKKLLSEQIKDTEDLQFQPSFSLHYC